MYDKDKRSFFEKLTGTVEITDDIEGNQSNPEQNSATSHKPKRKAIVNPPLWEDTPKELHTTDDEDGELAVDVYQTDSDIVIQAMIAGVKPDDMKVSITRDSITIRGKRRPPKHIPEDNYFYNELYWGSFSRKITLPEEIIAEESEAFEKHGLLMLKLPKVVRKKTRDIRVQST